VLPLAGPFAVTVAVIVAVTLALGGCSAARPAPSAPVAVASASPARALADPAVPAPPPAPQKAPRGRPLRPGVPGVVLMPDVVVRNGLDPSALDPDDRFVLDRLVRLPPLGIASRKSDFWSPCVRDFVQLQPEAARDVLGEALSLYSTTCTGGPARRVEFRTPRTDRGAPAQSYLGLVGALEPSRAELVLRAAYHGRPVHSEQIALIADGVRWSSQRMDFDDDDGWEIATLPLTRELARVVKRAAEARDALLRFEAAGDYEDVVLTEDMKQDLRVMLDALDAINRP